MENMNINITEEMIHSLEEKGFKRWQKGSMDRLYINACNLGLTVERYNTGNIKRAYFNGESVSNSEGRRMITAKTYIDVKSGRVYSDNDTLKRAVMALLGVEDD